LTMMKVMKGKAWIFGDNLDVDYELSPFRRWRQLRAQGASEEELGKLAMSKVDPDFYKKITKGDFIVAGDNMGCGHDHSQGPEAIKFCGISAVIAESLHEWFLRNCILVGLPAVAYKGIKQKVKQGDSLELDYAGGKLTNLTTKETMTFKPLPSFLLKIMDAGTLSAYFKELVKTNKIDAYLAD